MPSVEARIRRLAAGQTLALTVTEWEALRGGFEPVEAHATGVAGDLLLLHGPNEALFALEEPSDDTRVLRRLADREAARRFVARRLEQYERMWDGCGCRIDYRD